MALKDAVNNQIVGGDGVCASENGVFSNTNNDFDLIKWLRWEAI